MKPSDSPFPVIWWGTGLDLAGLVKERPDLGTYGQYDFAQLPAPPSDLSGSFDWLSRAGEQSGSIHWEKAEENEKGLEALRSGDTRLPDEFWTFAQDPSLQKRIRSCTDCFLHFAPAAVPSPVGDGTLVRFLADSQGCLFWYLYVTRDGSDHAVVCSPDFYGPEREEDSANPNELMFCADTFESFLWRFWLENEIWFSGYEKTPVPEAGKKYIEAYRKSE